MCLANSVQSDKNLSLLRQSNLGQAEFEFRVEAHLKLHKITLTTILLAV